MRKFALVLGLIGSPAFAGASPLDHALPGAALKGHATFSFLGAPIYEARLFTTNGQAFDWQQDFALELRYLRSITAKNLVTATLREMNRAGASVPIDQQLATCFRDVTRGDAYLAVTDGPNKIRFWLNDRPVCSLDYDQITYKFMGVFLGDDTRSAGFTRELRGH